MSQFIAIHSLHVYHRYRTITTAHIRRLRRELIRKRVDSVHAGSLGAVVAGGVVQAVPFPRYFVVAFLSLEAEAGGTALPRAIFNELTEWIVVVNTNHIDTISFPTYI